MNFMMENKRIKKIFIWTIIIAVALGLFIGYFISRTYMEYPQLQGLKDSDKEERINLLIENDVMKVLEEDMLFSENNLSLHLDYEIKCVNEKIISIFYKGWHGAVINGKNLPPICLATTIDMEKEKIVTLNDVIIDFDKLSQLLLNDKFESISTWDGVKGTGMMSILYCKRESKLIEHLKQTKFDIRDHNIEWYTDGNNLIIVSCVRDYDEFLIGIHSLKIL